jgi:hypothetical protein
LEVEIFEGTKNRLLAYNIRRLIKIRKDKKVEQYKKIYYWFNRKKTQSNSELLPPTVNAPAGVFIRCNDLTGVD